MHYQKLFYTIIFAGFIFNTQAQDLQDQLFLLSAKQIEQTKQKPAKAIVRLMEERLIDRKGFKKQKDSCTSCREGMYYAFARLYWLGNDQEKARDLIKNIEWLTNKAKEEEEKTFLDKLVLQELDDMVKHKENKHTILFLTGYSLVHQYYLTILSQKDASMEHIFVEGASSYEILPLLFESYNLEIHHKNIQQELQKIADLLDDAYAFHEQSESLDFKITDDGTISEDTPIMHLGNFDGKCKHATKYQAILVSILEMF